MGYFAVCTSESDRPILNRCHINLWSLSGIFGPVFYFDVGLEIANFKSQAQLSLALPFSVHDDGFVDLSDKVRNPKLAELIFGEPVDLIGDDLRFSDQRKICVTPCVATIDGTKSDQHGSVWSVSVGNVSDTSPTYIRARFRVKSFPRAWTRQSSGSLIDLRLCDVREAVSAPSWQMLKSQTLPITKLNLLVVVPASLKCRDASPATKHVRLLESETWAPYLNRKGSVFGKSKLTVYHWKNEKTITVVDPFRAYLDLVNEHSILSLGTYFFFIAAFIAFAIGITSFAGDTRAFIEGSNDGLKTLVVSILGLPILKYVAPTIRVFASGMPKIGEWARRLDQFVYGYR